MHVFFVFFFILFFYACTISLHCKSYSLNHSGILHTLLLFLILNKTFLVVTGPVKRVSLETFHFFLSLSTKVLFPICCSMFIGGENWETPFLTCPGCFTLTWSPVLKVWYLAPRLLSVYFLLLSWLLLTVSFTRAHCHFGANRKNIQLCTHFTMMKKLRRWNGCSTVRGSSVTLQELSHCMFPLFPHLFRRKDAFFKDSIPPLYSAIALWIIYATMHATYSSLL